jgi:WD40 repeat protein
LHGEPGTRRTGRLRLLSVRAGAIHSQAVAPGSGLAATGASDGTVMLWDLAAGVALRTLRGHTLPVAALAFSPDGKRVASVATDVAQPAAGSEMKIWNISDGRELAAARMPKRWHLAASFSPDGRHLLTGGFRLDLGLFGWTAAGEIEVWNPETGREERSLAQPGQPVFCLAFSPDGSSLVAGSGPVGDETRGLPRGAGAATLWSTTDWRQQRRIGSHEAGLFSVEFTPDGKRLVTAGVHMPVRLWDVAGGREVLKLEGNQGVVRRATVSPDGRRLATAGFDGLVKLWDLQTAKELATLRGHAGLVYGADFSADGRGVITSGIDGTVRLWDATTGELDALEVPCQEGAAARVAFSPDGRSLGWTSLTLEKYGEVGVWNVAEGKTVFAHRDRTRACFGLAFSPDGSSLYVGTAAAGRSTGSIQVRDANTGRVTQTLDVREGGVGRLAPTPDGRWLISSCQTGPLSVWDMQTGTRPRSLAGHRLDVFALAVSPDGKRLASGAGKFQGPGGELTLWDLASGEGHPFQGVKDGVTGLAFSPDGGRLASAHFGEEILVWDVETRALLRKLGHPRMAIAVAYSPDGRRLATGGYDGTMTIWEAETGDPLLTLKGHARGVSSLAFDAGGYRLASGAEDGKVLIWDVTPVPPH